MSDPHFGRSQFGYLFTYCGTAILWKSTKQTMHVELLAIHEASRKCIWLRYVIQHMRGSCGLSGISNSPTILFEDTSACIKQLKEGYIKEIDESTYYQNSSTLMNFKKMVILMYNKFAHAIIWRIYLRNHYRHQHLRS